jgi:hypothetical protein
VGEARKRRAQGLGFKSESREVQKIMIAKEKAIVEEMAFEKCLRDGEEDPGEWEGFNDETGEFELLEEC